MSYQKPLSDSPDKWYENVDGVEIEIDHSPLDKNED